MHLGFLHTAASNVVTFHRLVEAIDPSLPVTHRLLENVLAAAVETGSVTDAMRLDTEGAIRALAAGGATVVVCTCSTIGGVAEATAVPDVHVMRIDRPMAEQAVSSGRRILVAATLPSTLRPTIALIRQVAASTARHVDIAELLCGEAWPHFERGDGTAYAKTIAEAVARAARPGDIVVLAQASMAPAAERIRERGIAVLASPELGVRAAIQIVRRA